MSEGTQLGMGVHQMWGMTPAFDCVDVYDKALGIATLPTQTKGQKKKAKKKAEVLVNSDEPINILLAQPGDIRHVLKTLAQRRRHKKRPVHFYISEVTNETLARHMLLMRVLADWELPMSDEEDAIEDSARLQSRYRDYQNRPTAQTTESKTSQNPTAKSQESPTEEPPSI